MLSMVTTNKMNVFGEKMKLPASVGWGVELQHSPHISRIHHFCVLIRLPSSWRKGAINKDGIACRRELVKQE